MDYRAINAPKIIQTGTSESVLYTMKMRNSHLDYRC